MTYSNTDAKLIKLRTCKSCTYYDVEGGMCIRTLNVIHHDSSVCASYAKRVPITTGATMTYSDTDAKPIKTRFCATCEHYNTRDSFYTKLSRSRSKRGTCYAYEPRVAPVVKRVRWTVYDNTTDDVLITCGTIDECCTRLGVTESGFRKAVWLFRQATTEEERMRLPYYFIRQETDW